MNGDPPYASPNTRVVVHYLADSALRISNLRAPGKIANVFAVESFTDEMAAAAGADRGGIPSARAQRSARDRSAQARGGHDWLAGAARRRIRRPRRATARSAAAWPTCVTSNRKITSRLAMEVAVDRASGRIQVRRITCAHDCGLIVNPDGLRNQVEGCILQTLSRALHEEVKFDRSRVTSVDWASYPILRFPEVPPVEVALIDRPEMPPVGAGEAATAPVAAALANAIFDATGVRLRTVPFTPARVESALAKA